MWYLSKWCTKNVKKNITFFRSVYLCRKFRSDRVRHFWHFGSSCRQNFALYCLLLPFLWRPRVRSGSYAKHENDCKVSRQRFSSLIIFEVFSFEHFFWCFIFYLFLFFFISADSENNRKKRSLRKIRSTDQSKSHTIFSLVKPPYLSYYVLLLIKHYKS